MGSYRFLPLWQAELWEARDHISKTESVNQYLQRTELNLPVIILVRKGREIYTYYISTDLQRQTAVTVYFTSKQLLLFVFAWRSVCQYSMAEENHAAQRQTAVTAYFTSKQLQLFVFARRSVCQYSMAEENPAAQRQTAVTADL